MARHRNTGTGLVTAVEDYANVTLWDVGSMLAAFLVLAGIIWWVVKKGKGRMAVGN